MSSCPICLAPLQAEAHAEAFLYPCFHRFCYPCIAAWTETRRSIATSGGDGGGAAEFTCPLCRRLYDCVLHSFTASGSFAVLPAGTRALGVAVRLSPAQRRRRSIYGSGDAVAPRLAPAPRAVCAPRRPEHPQTLAWLDRELSALLLDADVSLLVQHVLGVLQGVSARLRAARSAPRAPSGGGRLLGNSGRAGSGASGSGVASERSVVYGGRAAFSEAVAGSLCGFLPVQEATQFAAELWSWLHSGLSIAAHDAMVFGAGGDGDVGTAAATGSDTSGRHGCGSEVSGPSHT